MIATGHHVAAWRHPTAQANASIDFAHYARIAKAAERACFDMVFIADQVTIGSLDEALHRTARADFFEPLTLLSALAGVTERIGLTATVTTTYNEPYHVARKFASLDMLSGGRAGWNLVTSSNAAEAFNFNRSEHWAHSARYDRAREFAQIVQGLWDSWEDDAFVRDPETGIFFHPEKMHPLDHEGTHFKVRGPLNVGRSPQGKPVLVQAGSSETGRAFAAETAEVIFGQMQALSEGQAFYADIHSRMAALGRNPDDVKIMPGVSITVGETREEAQRKFDALQALVHPVVGLKLLSDNLGGIDLSGVDPDGPLPDMPETEGPKARQKLLIDLARRENLSVRDLYLRIAGARGHWNLIGSAKDIADKLEEYFVGRAADGFNLMPPTLPGALDDFIALALPELRRRGLFREEYEGPTLRDNLGLRKPIHPFLERREAAEKLSAE